MLQYKHHGLVQFAHGSTLHLLSPQEAFIQPQRFNATGHTHAIAIAIPANSTAAPGLVVKVLDDEQLKATITTESVDRAYLD